SSGILWSPVIKCGAKKGDSWLWSHPFLHTIVASESKSLEERKYIVDWFSTYEGRPCVGITIESNQMLLPPNIIKYLYHKTYAKGIGLVNATTKWNVLDPNRDEKPGWQLTSV